MTEQEATIVAEAMSAVPYFPASEGAKGLIVSEIAAMVPSFEQGVWLARRMSQLYSKWPGAKEMRAVYCGRYKPADGIEVDSEVFADGIPSERKPEPVRIGPPEQDTERKLIADMARRIR